MAPEIDINGLSQEQKELYDNWGKEKAGQRLIVAGPRIISGTTAQLKVSLVDGEPVVEYASNGFVSQVHKLYVSQKISDELSRIGIPSVMTSRQTAEADQKVQVDCRAYQASKEQATDAIKQDEDEMRIQRLDADHFSA